MESGESNCIGASDEMVCTSTSAEVMVTRILVEKKIGSSESVVILDDKAEESMDCKFDAAQQSEKESKEKVSAFSQPDDKPEESMESTPDAAQRNDKESTDCTSDVDLRNEKESKDCTSDVDQRNEKDSMDCTSDATQRNEMESNEKVSALSQSDDKAEDPMDCTSDATQRNEMESNEKVSALSQSDDKAEESTDCTSDVDQRNEKELKEKVSALSQPDNKPEESMECASDAAQQHEKVSKDNVFVSSQSMDKESKDSVSVSPPPEKKDSRNGVTGSPQLKSKESTDVGSNTCQPKDKKPELKNKVAPEERNANKKREKVGKSNNEKKADESTENNDISPEQVQSALAVFFKGWDKFTKQQKDEIERFIRYKTKVITVKNCDQEREAQLKKKNESNTRTPAANTERKRNAPTEETNKNTVKKETTDSSSRAALRLRSVRRSRRNRNRRQRRQNRTRVSGDQAYQTHSRYRQSHYRERRFDEPVRSTNPRGSWAVDSRLLDPRWRSPWTMGRPEPEVVREPMELMMNELGRFIKMVSSMPAVIAPSSVENKPAAPAPLFYSTGARSNDQHRGDENHPHDRHALRRTPPPLLIRQQLNQNNSQYKGSAVKVEDVQCRYSGKSFSPTQYRHKQQTGVRNSPYPIPQGYFTAGHNTTADLRWADRQRPDSRIAQITQHPKDGRREGNMTITPWN